MFECRTVLLALDVCYSQYRLQELRIVHSILNVECIFNRQHNTIYQLQRLEHFHDFTGTTSQVHKFDKVEKALKYDHLVLVAVIELLEVVRVVEEILVEL